MADPTLPKRTLQLNARDRHDRRMGWFISEVSRQAANRAMRAKCEAYYDGHQIDKQEAAKMRGRGQAPVVFNEIAPSIDWLLGTERRTRIDFNVTPRQSLDREATEDAQNKKSLLKYLGDANRVGFERSNAWDDAMKSGLGWLEVGIRGDAEDLPVYVRSESWRNMLHDSYSPRKDGTEQRYNFRLKVLDLDIALAYFPGKEKELLKVRQQGDNLQMHSTWLAGAGNLMDLGLLTASTEIEGEDGFAMPLDLFNPRDRILVIECWSVEPHTERQPRPSPSAFDRTSLRQRVSLMTEYDTLEEDWSPYRHNRSSFIQVWAYRDKGTGLPYPPIKRLLDKQDALNHAMSKAVFEVATNQILAEADAINDKVMTLEEIADEIADPSGVAVFAKGALQHKKVQILRGSDRAQAQLLLAEHFRNSMQGEASVTGENLGRDTNAVSGKAIGLKQDQGGVLSTELFDNLLLAQQQEGELTLSLMEQYMVKPLAVPIPGERGQAKMLAINQPQADGTYLNDITKRQARFVIGEQPWRANLGQAMFDSFMQNVIAPLAPVAPQVVVAILDIVFEFADLPNKESLLERIRSVTGQPGPDNKMTPEQQAAKEQQALLAQAQFQAQLAGLQAQVAEANAKGEKLDAEAMAKRLEALYMAAQAAQVAQSNPGVAPMTDEILKSVGFEDRHPDTTLATAPTAAPGAPIPPALQRDGALAGHQAGIETPGADGAVTLEGATP